MTEMTLFKTGKKIIECLEQAGYEGYFVGGAVRDYTLGRAVNDVDITTNALPDTIETLFDKTIDVGKEHGTVIVLMDDIPFEVTTYRVEGDYTDHRRPDQVYFTKHLKEDLSRRDFTINAMAMTGTMALYDPFEGMADLDKKVITTVGKADERFNEDALRMLRAVRFMSQLDFSLSKSTEDAITHHAHLLDYIAVERITAELEKLYKGINVNGAKEIIAGSLLAYMPFFKEINTEAYLKAQADSLESDVIIQIFNNPQLGGFLSALKLSNQQKLTIKESLKLLKDLTADKEVQLVSYLYDMHIMERVNVIIKENTLLGEEALDRLDRITELKPSLAIQNRSDLQVNGNSLMTALNEKGGPWLKDCLLKIERAILLNQLNNNEAEIINWVKSHAKYEDGHIIITE